jgi:hypothetical protein
MKRSRTVLASLFVGATILVAGCSDGAGNGVTFINPSTIRVTNNLGGPILFFFARPCGTTDWGQDMLPNDPVEGTIQPGTSKNFTVEAGCYDLRADHLATIDPGPLLTKEIFDQVATPLTALVWDLSEVPSNPI